jgi:glutamine cyclotransferase
MRIPFKKVLIALAAVITITLFACNNNSRSPEPENLPPAIPVINFALVKSYPHDTNLFTEGLLIHEGKLFEGTGSPEDVPSTRSVVGNIDTVTGKMSEKLELNHTRYFGEGIAFLNGKLFQLTYKNQVAFVYDAKSFKRIDSFPYRSAQGWGLTTDGHSLIMSDGTSNINYIDPNTHQVTKTIAVTNQGTPQGNINELEFIRGYIYSNVWMTNYIIKIDPATGNIIGQMDLGSLTAEAKVSNPKADVLNGIAYDSTTDRVFVTGKLWPRIYQINFPH